MWPQGERGLTRLGHRSPLAKAHAPATSHDSLGCEAPANTRSVPQASRYTPARQPQRSGIARVTLDLYRLHPKDFLGCLNVKATLYEMYSVSYDIRCTGFKAVLR